MNAINRTKKENILGPTLLIYLFIFFIPFRTDFLIGGIDATISMQFLLSFPLIITLFFSKTNRSTLTIKLWYAYVTLISVSAFVGENISNPAHGLWVAYQNSIVSSIIYPIMCIIINSRSKIQLALNTLILTATIASIIGIIQTLSSGSIFSGFTTNGLYLGFLYPLSYKALEERLMDYGLSKAFLLVGTNIYRAHGAMYSHNYFGVFLSVSSILTFGKLSGTTLRKGILFSLSLFLQLAALIATFSRAAWVAIFIGLAVYWYADMRYQMGKISTAFLRRIALVAVLIIMIGMIFSSSEIAKERLATIGELSENQDVISRILIWQIACEQGMEHPFLGNGCMPIYNVPDQAWGVSGHNILFDIFYRHGAIALAMVIYFMWQFFNLSRKACTYNNNKEDHKLAIGILGAFVSLIISSMGTGIFSDYCTSSLFWTLFAFSTCYERYLGNLAGATKPAAFRLYQQAYSRSYQ